MTRSAIATTLLAAVLGALAGCGDNQHPAPDGGMSDKPGSGSGGEAGRTRAIVVAGNFKGGGLLSTLDVPSRRVAKDVGPALAIGDDPVLRHVGHELFIVNRADGNSVTVLDDQTLALVEQLGTGDGTNPQDVAVVGDKLYLPTYETVGVTVVTRGTGETATIDLSADVPDGKPRCASAYPVGTDVYVACQLLDENFTPRGPGKVYVIDTATDSVRTSVTLTHANPVSLIEQVPAGAAHAGELLVGTVVFDGSQAGCVERIAPGDAPSAPGCLVDNADLSGYASRIAFRVDTTGAVAVLAAPAFDFVHGSAFVVDLSAAAGAPALSSDGETINDVAVCPSGEIVVADIAKNVNGLRVYAGGSELTVSPLAVGLPPKSTHGLACY
jgi:hypothetical protein